jgi:WD40 repeat protein
LIGRHLVSAFLACSAAWLVLHPQPARAIGSATQSTPPPTYFGQPPPGLTPARFAPGVVSTDEAVELNGVFTPDGRELFFTRIVDTIFTMFHARFAGGKWSAPRPLMVYANNAKATAVDMSVSADGKELYFLGQHTHEYTKDPENLDLWVSRLMNGEWTTARVLPPPISTPASESYPVVVGDGSLYFTSNRAGSLGLSDVYRAQRLAGGGFAEPVNVGPPISTEYGEGDTFVAPDESYLIMASRRPGGFGMGDLYVSFRGKDGRWQPPVNLGDTINTDQVEFCPMVTPDGRYLFFSRRWGATWAETTAGDVFWIDIKFLDRLKR